ncbi:MAG: PocR ligand-binding domain-containing protein [Deltaproteobacteria bacterium]|nr:PocR ligand-binding domain-containing protein [Deltaproteobacteria bacterium]
MDKNIAEKNGKIQGVLDDIERETHMTPTFVDKNGIILLSAGDYNPLCARIRANEDSKKFVCALTSQRMLKEVEKTRRPYIDFCEIGLYRFVIPIFSGNELIGAIASCGTKHPDEPVESFYVAKQLDIDENAAMQLIATAPEADPDKVKQVVETARKRIGSE